MFGEEGTPSFSSCQIRGCMISVRGLSVVGVRWSGVRVICGEKPKVHRDILSRLGKVTLHLYFIASCVDYLLALDASESRVYFLRNYSRGIVPESIYGLALFVGEDSILPICVGSELG